ncbi:hypothetical protein PG984_002993 [Apiospora sp. TS-2023a]
MSTGTDPVVLGTLIFIYDTITEPLMSNQYHYWNLAFKIWANIILTVLDMIFDDTLASTGKVHIPNCLQETVNVVLQGLAVNP